MRAGRAAITGRLHFDLARVLQSELVVGFLSDVEVVWRIRPPFERMEVSGRAAMALLTNEARREHEFAVTAEQVQQDDGRYTVRLVRCRSDLIDMPQQGHAIPDFGFAVLVDADGYLATFTRDPAARPTEDDAKARARQLLQRLLDPVQRTQFQDCARFDVITHAGTRYRLGSGRIEWQGGSFCYLPADSLVLADVLIAQLLYLRSKDANLARHAGETYHLHSPL